jgi:hypothetical protein
VAEDRVEPAAGVVRPAVEDRQQREPARRRRQLAFVKHAAVGRVVHLPAARQELVADRVRGREVAFPA